MNSGCKMETEYVTQGNEEQRIWLVTFKQDSCMIDVLVKEAKDAKQKCKQYE